MINELIGLKYPIKDTDEREVGYKTITSAKNIANVAGYGIELDNMNEIITIGFLYASELKEKQDELSKLPNLNKGEKNG